MAEKYNLDDYLKPKDQKTADTEPGRKFGTVEDFGLGLIDSAVARPYNATLGVVLPKVDLSNSYDHSTIAAKAGDFGGTVVDMVALTSATKWGVGKTLGWGAEKGFISASLAQNATLASTLSLGTAGALYGGVFTPGSAEERLKRGTVDFATFSTMGLASSSINNMGFLGKAGTRTFFQDVAAGGLSGLPAGIVNAEAQSFVNGKGLILDKTVAQNALYYTAFGAAMGGGGHAVEAAFKSAAKPAPAEVKPTAQAEPVKFNIPESGNIELGQMMKGLSAADQTRLVQEVIAARPKVPMGSWMRLIAAEDMPQFLRASHQMFPETALGNAGYLIGTRNLRPPTAESPPIDFKAWEKALAQVKAEVGK